MQRSVCACPANGCGARATIAVGVFAASKHRHGWGMSSPASAAAPTWKSASLKKKKKKGRGMNSLHPSTPRSSYLLTCLLAFWLACLLPDMLLQESVLERSDYDDVFDALRKGSRSQKKKRKPSPKPRAPPTSVVHLGVFCIRAARATTAQRRPANSVRTLLRGTNGQTGAVMEHDCGEAPPALGKQPTAIL